MLRLLSLALRGFTLLSRFALLFLLARFVKPETVGLYGLFTTTVNLCVLVVGLDFYTYAQRELLAVPVRERAGIVLHQAAFHAATYLLILPLLLIIFFFDLMPFWLVGWFYLLLVLEHIAQEINRLLAVLGRPFVAGVVLFLRMAAWAWVVIAAMWFVPATRNLPVLFSGWAVGGTIAVIVGAGVIRHDLSNWQLSSINWQWLRKGVKIGSVFLAASLCFRGLMTVDRYLVEAFGSIAVLGAYTLYVGVAMSIMTFLESGVFVFLYPKVVETFKLGESDEFRRAMWRLGRDTVVVTALISLAAALIAPHIFALLGHSVYVEHILIFYLLLTAAVIQALSMVPHYALYAFGRDRIILGAQVSAFAVFVVAAFSLRASLDVLAVPVGLCVAFGWILVLKTAVCFRHWASEMQAIAPQESLRRHV